MSRFLNLIFPVLLVNFIVASAESRLPNPEGLVFRLQSGVHNDDWTLKSADIDPCSSPAILTKPEGIINYPGGGRYSSFKYCRWIIYARDPRSKIRIAFTFMNIEQDDPCDDYVQVLEMTHKPNANGQHTATDIAGRLCKSNIRQLSQRVYEVDSPAALVVFKSDWIFTARGFTLTYAILEPEVASTTREPRPPTRITTATTTITTATTMSTRATTTTSARKTTARPTRPRNSWTTVEPFDANRYACDFENGHCSWINKPGARIRFAVKQGRRSVWTNWAKEDHTTGSGNGHYIYLYTNRKAAGNSGILISPELPANPNSPRCLTFYYNILQTTSSLVVSIFDQDGNKVKEMFSRDGGQGKNWHPGRVNLENDNPFFVEISHSRGVYAVESGVAIDDISISDQPCPSTRQQCGRSTYSSMRSKTWEAVAPPPGSETTDFTGEQIAMGIVGGVDAVRHNWPWVIRMRVYKQGIKEGTFSQCGGSLIHPEWLVTAAHCFESGTTVMTDPENTMISFGEHDVTESVESEFTVRPKRIFVHPQRRQALRASGVASKANDIALLKLKNPVTMNDVVNTVCLPHSPIPPGTPCYALGWGLDETDQVSPVLQQLVKMTLPKEDCSYPVADGMTCAIGNGYNDVCAGDSGGPLVCKRENKYELVGVVSFGDKCSAKRRTSGVYADIFHFKSWIQNTMVAN